MAVAALPAIPRRTYSNRGNAQRAPLEQARSPQLSGGIGCAWGRASLGALVQRTSLGRSRLLVVVALMVAVLIGVAVMGGQRRDARRAEQHSGEIRRAEDRG